MPFSFLGKRVSLDAGQELWNTMFARQEDFHGSRPALISTYYGKPGHSVWLFPFKVPRVGRLSTRWTPVSSFHTILHAYWQAEARMTYLPVDEAARKDLHTRAAVNYFR